jgi:hypothetical protein
MTGSSSLSKLIGFNSKMFKVAKIQTYTEAIGDLYNFFESSEIRINYKVALIPNRSIEESFER